MVAIPIKISAIKYPAIGFGLAYACIIIWFVPNYVNPDANLYLGLLLAPYICTVERSKLSLRYLLPAMLATGLAILLPVNTLFFIALLFVVLLFIENCLGKMSNVLLFLLMLISPVFRHMTRLAEFPVRLWLTEQVSMLLNFMGISAAASGNQILLGKYEFSVDRACAGLNMLVTSGIICLFVLAYYQRSTYKKLGFAYLLVLCLVTIGLNILCNYFRILIIVLFKIMPGTLFHDVTGLFCLLLYVMLPLLLGIKPLLNRLGKAQEVKELVNRDYAIRYPAMQGLFLISILYLALHIVTADSLVPATKNIHLSGYSKTRLSTGILKFEDKDALIYLKPAAFYAPEHDPMICWTGSGYQFNNIRKESIAGLQVYTAQLQNRQDIIYAAWWFDNGRLKTVNQFEWRWSAAKGASQFYLVNVNASNPQQLKIEIQNVLKQNPMLSTIKQPRNENAKL